MIEIVLLIVIYRNLARHAAEIWRSSSWGVLGIVLWIFGELVGAGVGYSVGVEGLGLYVFALAGAALGALLAWHIVKRLEPGEPPETDDGLASVFD